MWEAAADDFEVIDLPPETHVPSPPEEIARPGTPVIAPEPFEEDITIAMTDIVERAAGARRA